jgi:beta-N-acetylhexosaminidase
MIEKLIKLLLILALFGGMAVHASTNTLSLRDKIAQILILGFPEASVSDDSEIVKSIQEENIGGVILFDYNFKSKTFDKNIKSPEQVATLNQALQMAASQGNKMHHREALPLIISVDYEGGRVNRLKDTYGFPKTVSAEQFSALSEQDAKKQADIMAKTLKSNGFNLDFAPVLDVNVNPENPVIGKLGRSYSADPEEVIFRSHLLTKAFKEQGIGAAFKHFPGHGSSTGDSHLGFVDVTETWQSYELTPFQELISHMDKRDMIMTAHIVNRQLDKSGLPATLSKEILTGLLRERLGFEGIIITDDMQMKAISDHYGLEESLVLAINAGADMFIFGNQLSDVPMPAKTLIDLIEKNVNDGTISEARIDEAYSHVRAFKLSLA